MIGIIPITAKEALENWDKGEPIFTIEMGGLGPGYEQTIHIAIFELMRRVLGKTLPKDDKLKPFLDKHLHKVNAKFNLGMSGAQAGAVIYLAYRYLKDGYRKTVEDFKGDRRIQVDNRWRLK